MGDPAQPGEDQLTTVFIEGPPAGASKDAVDAYNQTFEGFKRDLRAIRQKYGAKIKTSIRKIEYVKKE